MNYQKKYQRGSVMILGLAMVATCLLVAIGVFNIGQTVTEKIRITNTADAAVYSGAIWQARTLNYQAYINRAMVANEVAIAQTVSLISWLRYIDQSEKNISLISGWNPAFESSLKISGKDAAITGASLEAAAPHIIESLSKLNQEVLSASQLAVHNAGFMASSEVINAVIRSNDSYAHQTMASKSLFATYEAEYLDFTIDNKGSKRRRIKTIINSALDKFSKRRTWTQGSTSAQLKKRGGVSMVGLDKWEAFDTLSTYKHECDSTGCEWQEKTPIGWGGIKAEKNLTTTVAGSYGSAKINDAAFAVARSHEIIIPGYGGLPASRDIRDVKIRNNEIQTLKLAIEAAKPGNKVRTASLLRIGADRLATKNNYANDEISALAKAEVYFKYPDNQNYKAFFRKIEYANLYNPFWQARLIAPDPATDIPAVLIKK